VLEREGRPRFYDLMFRRGEPAFITFDVLALEGRDLRECPLLDRKKILRRLIPRRSPFVLYADFIETRGRDFFGLVCARDLEGIVAKWKAAPYPPKLMPSSWIKIKNPEYSQARDRAELFER
jgi:bifunctional non-homologous end joining protein LigD